MSLDELTQAVGCTRRNAQLVIKKLVSEGWIEWQAGIGRGNLPRIKLLKALHKVLQQQADFLISENKLDQALLLIEETQRDAFLESYIAGYQSKKQGENSDQDILHIPFYRGTHGLDPIYISRRTESHIASYLYSNLLRFDPLKNTFEGDLAIDWKREAQRWHFTLRKGLKFHDASPLDAYGVKAHFERLKAANHQNRHLFTCIQQIEVLGPLRLVFHMRSMTAYLPALLTNSAAGITKAVNLDGQESVIGSGSFVLSEQNNWLTRLTVFKHYHGFRPWMDAIEIWNIGDKAKDFKLHCDLVHPHQLEDIEAHLHPQFEQKAQWEKGCEYVLINANRCDWLAHKPHRLALQSILQALALPTTVSQGQKAEQICAAKGMLSVPTSQQYHLPENQLSHAKHLAQALFKRLNQEQREITRIEILTYQLPQHIAMAQYYCERLQALGFPAHYQVEEFPVFNLSETASKADIIISGEVFSEAIMDMSWLGWLKANSSLETCLSSEQRSWRDETLDAIGDEPDENKRADLFNQMESELIAAGSYLPLFHVQQRLNQADSLNPMALLANGWIDFNRVTFK